MKLFTSAAASGTRNYNLFGFPSPLSPWCFTLAVFIVIVLKKHKFSNKLYNACSICDHLLLLYHSEVRSPKFFATAWRSVGGGGKLIFESFTICLEKCCKTIIYNVNHVCNIITQKKYVLNKRKRSNTGCYNYYSNHNYGHAVNHSFLMYQNS